MLNAGENLLPTGKEILAMDIIAQVIPNIDYSNVHNWQFYTFIGVSILIILGVLLPTLVTLAGMFIKSSNASNKQQLLQQEETHKSLTEAMTKSYQTQLSGLMEHQKEQIERICNSHVKQMELNSQSFEKAIRSFDKAIERRDQHQADIMRELRIINDKIDNVAQKLEEHIKEC
jgi:hypothetical protein